MLRPEFMMQDPLAAPQNQEDHRYEVEVIVWDETTDEPILRGSTVYRGRILSVKEWIWKKLFIMCNADHLRYRIWKKEDYEEYFAKARAKEECGPGDHSWDHCTNCGQDFRYCKCQEA